MGNGRGWGRASRRNMVSARAFGSVLTLLLAGSGLIGFSSHRFASKTASIAASPVPAAQSLLTLPHAKPDVRGILGQLPMIFEPNQGQADPREKFLARGAGYRLFLDNSGALLGLHSAPGRSEHFVRMKLANANPATVTVGSELLPGKSNYLMGNDLHKWHSGIPQFAQVHYDNVYPGIDLVFYGNQGHLEYDLKVAPGADPSR
ncbi:MAG TPA: hypothetical protein VFE08_09635, partial [Candidatus Sulfotelmatobacter sp.]|nr:hypothetical protein [Candidatus Sulfotelmatobacter sp.]